MGILYATVTASEKAKLLQSGASSSQTPIAGTTWLGYENSWIGALFRLGSDFDGAAWIYLIVFETLVAPIEAGKK